MDVKTQRNFLALMDSLDTFSSFYTGEKGLARWNSLISSA